MQIALQVFGEHEKLRPSQWHSGRSNASRLNALAKCVCQQPEFVCCLFLFVVRQGGAGLLRGYEPATAVAFAADFSDITVA